MIGFSPGGAAAKRTLEFEIKITGNNDSASKAMKGLAAEADKVTQGLGKAAQAAAGIGQAMNGGGGAFPAGMYPPGTGPGMIFPASMYPGQRPAPSGNFPLSMSIAQQGGNRLHGFTPPAPLPTQPTPQPGWARRNLGGMGEGTSLYQAAGQFGVVSIAAEATTGLAEAFGNIAVSAGTARQKVDQFGASIPVIGSLMTALVKTTYSLSDAFNERTIRMRDPSYFLYQTVEKPVATHLYGQQVEAERLRGLMGREQAEQARRVTFAREMMPPDFAASALGGFGFAGPLATIDPRVQEAQRAVRKAEYEARLARGTALGARASASGAYERVVEEFGDREGRGSRLGELNIRYATEELKEKYQRARKDPYYEQEFRLATSNFSQRTAVAEKDLSRYEKEIAEARERSVAAAQKDYELAQARTSEMRAQIAVLREKEEKSRSAAISFGSMAPDQQSEFLYAEQLFRKGGVQALPPELRGLIASNPLTADRYAKSAEDEGNANPIFRKLLDQYGLRDSATIRGERLKAEQELKVTLEFNEQKLYEALERIFKKFDESTDELIKKKLQLEDAKRTVQQIQSATSGG